MTLVDLVVIGVALVFALVGASRGLTALALALAGLLAGAWLGARLAPLVLPEGQESPWLPLVALGGALLGATLVRGLVLSLSAPLRALVVRGPLRGLDRAGGVVAGAALGLALVWLAAVAALFPPGGVAREELGRSTIVRALVEAVPPDRVLGALHAIDPRPLLPGLALPPVEIDPSLADQPVARAAAASAVRISGRACGVGVNGSGWVAAQGLVVTNAHVIAGGGSPSLRTQDGGSTRGEVVHVDAADDIALVRAPGLGAPALALAERTRPTAAVILGYPGGGPLRVDPGSAGSPVQVLAPGGFGGIPRPRTIVPLRGPLAPGSSGGPVIDPQGRVIAMVFGGRPGGSGGAGVPASAIREALDAPRDGPVDTGPCPG